MIVLDERTLGHAWLAICKKILDEGADETYDGLATKELGNVTLVVRKPDPADELIAAHADPDWLAWMKANFTELADVPELGNARSYARRLRDYDGRDQVAWVVERLRADPATRSATITTFQPLADTSYIPCVSLLDFWQRDGELELVVYAHSLDFGKKAYGNLVELARLQHEVAAAVELPPGSLVLHAKSAHVYEPELESMRRFTQVAA